MCSNSRVEQYDEWFCSSFDIPSSLFALCCAHSTSSLSASTYCAWSLSVLSPELRFHFLHGSICWRLTLLLLWLHLMFAWPIDLLQLWLLPFLFWPPSISLVVISWLYAYLSGRCWSLFDHWIHVVTVSIHCVCACYRYLTSTLRVVAGFLFVPWRCSRTC